MEFNKNSLLSSLIPLNIHRIITNMKEKKKIYYYIHDIYLNYIKPYYFIISSSINQSLSVQNMCKIRTILFSYIKSKTIHKPAYYKYSYTIL